jgi:hypothetical protein
MVELLLTSRTFWMKVSQHHDEIVSFGMVHFMTFRNEKTMMVVLQRRNVVVVSRYTPLKSADWQLCLYNI